MPMAGKERGLVSIPEVGDEVLVAFEREDLRFPYVLGALWNGKDKPPLANRDGKNDKRILKSRKKHYLLFDDGARGVVELAHEKGGKIVFDDDGFAVQDEQGQRRQDRQQQRRDDDRGERTAQHQGRHDHDRSDRHARAQGRARRSPFAARW